MPVDADNLGCLIAVMVIAVLVWSVWSWAPLDFGVRVEFSENVTENQIEEHAEREKNLTLKAVRFTVACVLLATFVPLAYKYWKYRKEGCFS